MYYIAAEDPDWTFEKTGFQISKKCDFFTGYYRHLRKVPVQYVIDGSMSDGSMGAGGNWDVIYFFGEKSTE
eukprot:COSAG05_NODE_8815_length_669_cov_1.164912_1_plen_71_part_00